MLSRTEFAIKIAPLQEIMIKRLKRRLLGSIINSARHKFCERIVDRALLKKWPVTRIHEPFTLDLPMPDGFAYDEQSRMAFESEQHLKFPAQYLACIPNASVLAGFEAVSRKAAFYLRMGSQRFNRLVSHRGCFH